MFKEGGRQITRLDELRAELHGYVGELNIVRDYSRILNDLLINQIEKNDDINKNMLEMNAVNMDPYNESGHNMNIENILNADKMLRYLDKLQIFNDVVVLAKEIYKNAREVKRITRQIKENTDNITAEINGPNRHIESNNNDVLTTTTRTGGRESISIKRTRRIKSRNRKSRNKKNRK